MGLSGGLMVCGTGSDAGKSTIVAGLCRLLSRQGIRVAPFKSQNMALNSAVTVDGHEIGRAQASQAWAAGVEPEVSMNPILLKPTRPGHSQVVVMGRPWAVLDAASYQSAKAELWPVVTAELAKLRERFDVVLCEGAGSPAEINLLGGDIVNLRVALHAGFRSIVVGDIDRGGVFASLYGTVGLLPDDLSANIGGFVINKFRGNPALLAEGPADLMRRTGVPTIGVVPWLDGLRIDAEDSLALARFPTGANNRASQTEIDVAVVRLPHISNFTDIDALVLEPGVAVRLVSGPSELGVPDLLILPGTKATVEDLEWLRSMGLESRIRELARTADVRTTVLGVCGGYQMMGAAIEDDVESGSGTVGGMGLFDTRTRFEPEKLTRRVRGHAWGKEVSGYEIRHGRTVGGDPWIQVDHGVDADQVPQSDSVQEGRVLGTTVHGMFECDGFRQEFLTRIADRCGKAWRPNQFSFSEARASQFDAIADALEANLDLPALEALIAEGSGSLPTSNGIWS